MSLFKRRGEPAVYTLGGGWGDAIQFFPEWKPNSNTQKVCGWKPRIPVRGDRLLVPMRSGSTAVFEFTSVERCGDPPDMFFGEVKHVEYCEEKK